MESRPAEDRAGRAPKTSQEVIDLLKVEILRLKIENNRLRAKLNLAMEGGEQLTQERGCQTNLDLMNMEELMRANWTLKRKMREEGAQPEAGFQVSSKPRSMDHISRYAASSGVAAPNAPAAGQQPVPTKLNHRPQQPAAAQQQQQQQLAPDEKQLLEKLFRIDGDLTITHDKLVAKLGGRC